MGAPKHSAVDKAAILLLGMGHELAAEIMKHLSPEELKRVGNAMHRLGVLEREVFEKVLREFTNSLQTARHTKVSMTPEFAKMFPGLEEARLQSADLVDGETLAKILEREHPQTIALVLAHLSPEKGAAMLKALPHDQHAALLMRLATLESVSREELEALDQHLEEEISRMNHYGKKKVGGVEKVASILNAIDRTKESAILAQIAERHPTLSDDIKSHMFVFDDLARLDARAIQELIKAVPQKLWTLALRGANEAIQKLVFENMSKRGADMLREDMAAMGKVKLSDALAAQGEILAMAKKLDADGKISLAAGTDEYV